MSQRLAWLLASLLLSFAAAEESGAWALYNDTSGELEYEVYDDAAASSRSCSSPSRGGGPARSSCWLAATRSPTR